MEKIVARLIGRRIQVTTYQDDCYTGHLSEFINRFTDVEDSDKVFSLDDGEESLYIRLSDVKFIVRLADDSI